MKSECPFCGFQSSVYAVQLHIDQKHTSNSALQHASSSPTATRGPLGGGYGVPASDPYPVKERRIVTKRYPVDEPSWIKCGIRGCGQYVTRSTMNDHLDMHDAADMQAEEEQRARRMAMSPASGGPYHSSRALKRISYGPMMGDDYDGSSTVSGNSGGSDSSSMARSAANGKSSGGNGRHGKHGSGGEASGKDRKSPSRKDARGWSRSSNSGKGKDSSGRSTKSSSSSVVSSSSKARSDGGRGDRSESKGASNGGGGSGRSGGGAGGAGNGSDGPGGSGSGGRGASERPGDGSGGNRGKGNRSGPGSSVGGPKDPFMMAGDHSPDMGGLELQLAKLLLANRASPNAHGAMPGAPNMANSGISNLTGNPNPPMSLNSTASNDLLQAIQKSIRPQSRDPNPYSLDQRVPSEAANLLAALVFSRAGTS